jgi:hypothetical protein
MKIFPTNIIMHNINKSNSNDIWETTQTTNERWELTNLSLNGLLEVIHVCNESSSDRARFRSFWYNWNNKQSVEVEAFNFIPEKKSWIYFNFELRLDVSIIFCFFYSLFFFFSTTQHSKKKDSDSKKKWVSYLFFGRNVDDDDEKREKSEDLSKRIRDSYCVTRNPKS